MFTLKLFLGGSLHDGPGPENPQISPRGSHNAHSGMKPKNHFLNMPRPSQFWAHIPVSMPNNTGTGPNL